ncbi:MAG: hypothetical protein MRJ67_06715 [Nitrospirales bacterium]|nr:hypothetical protein [Nitrospirales bacterium]
MQLRTPTPAARPHHRTLLFLTGLSEPRELARHPYFVSDQCNETGGALLFLGPFASTTIVAPSETRQAIARLPGRNPANLPNTAELTNKEKNN